MVLVRVIQGMWSCANAVYMLQVEEQTCVFIRVGEAFRSIVVARAAGPASGKTTTAKLPSSVFAKVRAWSDFVVRAAIDKSALFRR